MKKTILISSIILASVIGGWGWGKYPSKEQAGTACEEWLSKGKKAEWKGEMNAAQKNSKFFDDNDINLFDGKTKNERYSNWLNAYVEYNENTQYTNRSLYSRKCVHERETKQFLGKINKTVESGQFDNKKNKGVWKVAKNFRY